MSPESPIDLQAVFQLFRLTDRLSVHVEHESTIEASAFSSTLKDVKQLPTERQYTTVFVFRDFRPQAKYLPSEIHVTPLKLPHLAHPPTRKVEEGYRISQVYGDRRLEGEEGPMIEEALTGIVLLKERDVRLR